MSLPNYTSSVSFLFIVGAACSGPVPSQGADASPSAYFDSAVQPDVIDADTRLPLPEALASLVPNVWTPISKNLFSDVDPCPERTCGYSAVSGQGGVVHAYNGGVFASNEGSFGGLALWGGGHNGYYGNEMYYFDLGTQLWSRLSEPTVGQTPGDPNTFGLDLETCRFYDGKPMPRHTYDAVSYIASTREFVITTLGDVSSFPPSNPDGGCRSLAGATFNFEDTTWGTLAPAPETQGYTISEYDQSRDALWMWRATYGVGGLARYDLQSASWTTFADDQAPPAHATGAIDPTHDLMVVLRFFYSDAVGVVVKDLAAPDERGVLVTTEGGDEIEAQANEFKGFVGIEWVPSLGRFVAWVSGSTLYYLTPPDGDWRTETWSWSKVDLLGTAPSRPANVLGPAGKFQVAPELGIAFVLTDTNDPVYAVKLALP